MRVVSRSVVEDNISNVRKVLTVCSKNSNNTIEQTDSSKFPSTQWSIKTVDFVLKRQIGYLSKIESMMDHFRLFVYYCLHGPQRLIVNGKERNEKSEV